jgi:RHS repeat-associated protein
MSNQHPPRAAALAALSILIVTGCGGGATRGSAEQAVRTTTRVAYYHATISAGPALITRDDGSLLDERRDEPFGVAIDSYSGTGTGPVDYARDPHNSLNKETDTATGWSDHGARWLAVDTARWLTPDPPVKAPDPAFMTEPWGLHPYQYVKQNPILFWDPDGRDEAPILMLDCRARCDANGMVAVAAPAARSQPSTARQVQSTLESAVGPTITIASSKWSLISKAQTVDGDVITKILPEASRIAKPLQAVDGVMSFGLGVTRAFQYNLATTQPEKDDHAGGALLNAASLTPLALPIAIWGLFDPGMNARVGRGMHAASDALARALVGDVDEQRSEAAYNARIEQERQERIRQNSNLPAASTWQDPEWAKLNTHKLKDGK